MSLANALVAIDEDMEVLVNGQAQDAAMDLFNTRGFHDLHRGATTRSYYFVLRHRRTGEFLAAVHFHEAGAGHLESPWRGSFGGFATIPAAGLSLPKREGFVSCVQSFLRNEGIERLTIVFPPLAYHPEDTSVWIDVLLRAGFAMSRHELSYAIAVDGQFADRIDSGNRKRLRKCVRDGFVGARLDHSEYEDAFQVIAENRQRKGYSLSMSWPAVRDMCQRLPDQVLFFGVRRDAALVAAAVCLRINPRAIFVVYWGELAGVEAWSPVTLLASHIYDYCGPQGITLLDIGTANIRGVPNYGLIRYKTNLGCTATLKLTLAKVLS